MIRATLFGVIAVVGAMGWEHRPASAERAAFRGTTVDRYPDGRVDRTTELRDGRRDGAVRSWYPNGALEFVRHYAADREDGVHDAWYADGRPRFHYRYVAGVME